MVIGHTECGMAGSDPDKLRNAMIERGIPQEEIDKVDLKSWIGGFEDEEKNVIDTVEKIRNHPRNRRWRVAKDGTRLPDRANQFGI